MSLVAKQGLVQQQTAEVDNAETAAVVAVDDREAAAKKLAAAQRNLQDAKGKQQHSLQVTANSDALPEVTKPVSCQISVPHEAVMSWLDGAAH